jgi:hypothetical protein
VAIRTAEGVVSADLHLVAPEELSLVAEFRETARRILRSDLTVESRKTALLRLYQRAKREPFADLIVGAIVAEVFWSIDRDDVIESQSAGEPMERAHRSLRGRGYARCPECWCELSQETDWSSWRQAREGAEAEFMAREGAVT